VLHISCKVISLIVIVRKRGTLSLRTKYSMIAFDARDAFLKILHNSKLIFFIGVNVN
jgi:hypothetical protein